MAHTKKQKSRVRVFSVILLIVIFIVFGHKFMTVSEGQDLPENVVINENQPLDMAAEPHISFVDLHSPYAMLVALEDYTILLNKNCEEKVYPASLTKMLTTIVAIENLPDLSEEIILTNAMFQGLYEANASLAGFLPGEAVKAVDLLYGVMLPSGAEACIALADRIAGSEHQFVDLMNQKAADLGMTNTHLTNTTGLHDNDHYTTVGDLSMFLNYALQDDTFREIFTTSRHVIQPTNKHSNGITLYSTMFERLGDSSFIGGKVLGGKTGYTDEAGLCLASLAEKEGKEYILITTGAKGSNRSVQYNIIDALAVYNSLNIQ